MAETSPDISAPQELDEFLGVPARPWWQRWLKWIVGGVAALVVILLLWHFLGGSSATQYAVQPVRRGALQVTVSATGRLEPTNQVQVGSELSGLVLKVLVDVNDRVTAGQTIALIDPAHFSDAVNQAKAQVDANKAAVAQADATLAQDRAQLARLEEVYRLSAGKVPSATDLTAARAESHRAVGALAAAKANVANATAALSSSQISLVKTVIRSPVNGVVLARQIQPGQTVAASFNTPVLFVIAEDLSKMNLPVAVDEADVGEVDAGQKANFTVDAFPGESFPATLTRVDLGSNQTVAASTSVTSTSSSSASQVVSYTANLAVANGGLRLRPGMTATAEIITRARSNVLLVPNSALRFSPSTATKPASDSGGFASALTPRRPGRGNASADRTAKRGRGARQTVYVLDNGKPKPVSIATGVSNGTLTEVVSGDLQPGMQVITGQLASGAN